MRSFAASVPLIVGLAAGAAAPRATAGDEGITSSPTEALAVVTRYSVLRDAPTVAAERLGTLDVGHVVSLFDGGLEDGYLQVQTFDEEVGWISARNARLLDPDEIDPPVRRRPGAPTRGPPSEDASAASAGFSATSGEFLGCPEEGNPSPRGPRYQDLLEVNRMKNRGEAPTDAQVDRSITLAKLLATSSDDSDRWSHDQAAEIEGYVLDVKPGGEETVNCKRSDLKDTHIELVLSPSRTAKPQRFIVEVTPRWRVAAEENGIDWTTSTLREEIEGKWVRVRGWLFFDSEHVANARNTNREGLNVWRATAWELHPVTSITVIPEP